MSPGLGARGESDDIEVIAVEGIAFGPEVAEKALSAALARVAAIAA